MVALVFAVACSVAIGMIFKHAGRQGLDRTALLTVNYAAAVGVAGVLLAFGGRTVQEGLTLAPGLVGLGILAGALLIAGFFLLSWATEVAGMSLAIGVMRVSVVLPFAASWLVWAEVPTLAQGIGMGLAAGAFFLMAHKERTPDPVRVPASVPSEAASGSSGTSSIDWQAAGVLALTFCMGGAVDISMKAFEETFGASNSRVLFLLLAFGVAFLIGAVLVAARAVRHGRWPSLQTIVWGVVLGVINYGSLEFILRAIEALPGPFVFPANNISIMVLAALLGVYVWGEHLTRANRVGLGLALVALVLLGL